MKLISNKRQSNDVKNIIKCLNLKEEAYEVKEDIISLTGVLLPITALSISGLCFGTVEAAALSTISLLPSMALILVGAQSSNKKHQNKVCKANRTYNDLSNKEVDVLSDEEKSRLLANAEIFENDPQTIEQMANRIKIANARRNAKFISKYDYKKQLEFVK